MQVLVLVFCWTKQKKICQPTHTHTRTLHQRNKKPAKKSSGLFFVVYFALSARVRFFVAPLVGSRRLFLQTICVFLTVAFCALTHKTEWFHQQHNKNKPAFQPRSKTKPTTTKIYPYTGPNAGSNAHNGWYQSRRRGVRDAAIPGCAYIEPKCIHQCKCRISTWHAAKHQIYSADASEIHEQNSRLLNDRESRKGVRRAAVAKLMFFLFTTRSLNLTCGLFSLQKLFLLFFYRVLLEFVCS